MSLRDAAEATGVSTMTLSRFENGHTNLDTSNVIAIANWLDIDLLAKPIEVYPDNTLDVILDVIRSDENVTDADALCEVFAAAYRGMAGC